MANEFKKVSVTKINLSTQKVGFTLEGKFLGFTESAPFQDIDAKTGEIVQKTMRSILLEDATGNRLAAIADKGLQSAITDAMISEGAWIKAVKLEKAQLSKGRTMNQYDVFVRS